ncbi:MAG: FecR family protein [Flavobacteriaceae bacterium]
MNDSQEKLEALLLRYFNQDLRPSELEELKDLVDQPTHAAPLRSFLELEYGIHLGFSETQKLRTKEQVFKQISRANKQRKIWQLSYQLAAAVVLFFGIRLAVQSPTIQLSPPEQKVTLTLENQQQYVIDEGFTALSDDSGTIINQKEDQRLVYLQQTKTGVVDYRLNTLEVPYGQQFGLVLEDGTQVQLNAGSSITFPEAFSPNAPRRIQLKGEAFFKVASDADRPFIVESHELEVEVLGTAFNVMSYPDEDRVEVVLTEGLVQLKDIHRLDHALLLTPDHRAIFRLADQQFTVDAVPTALYTSWIDGKVVFRDLSFDQIIQRLERLYNVKIYLRDSQLAAEIFYAGFDLQADRLEDVLQYFQKIHPFEYRVLDAQTLEIYKPQ